jgi:hypothetical protein
VVKFIARSVPGNLFLPGEAELNKKSRAGRQFSAFAGTGKGLPESVSIMKNIA